MGIEVGLATLFGSIGTMGAAGGAAAVGTGAATGIAGTAFTAGNILAGVATVGTVASTGMSIYGQQQAQKQSEKIAQHNLNVEAANREQLKAEGREQLDRDRQRNKRFLAQQRGSLAASGLQMDTGTGLEMEAESAAMLELEALDNQYKMNMGLRDSQNRSTAIRMDQQAKKRASNINIASTVMGGANQMARLQL